MDYKVYNIYGVTGGTNKALPGVKLLFNDCLSLKIHCGCFRASMSTQWLLFCFNVWQLGLAFISPPACSSTHSLYTESMILVAWKNVLQYLTSYYETIAIATLYKTVLLTYAENVT